MIDLMFDTVAPHICYGCGLMGAALCESCVNNINDDDFGRCIWCLRPSVRDHQCRACARTNGTFAAWAVGMREGTLLEVTDGYKFDSCRAAADTLAKLLDHALPLLDEYVVSWVPTSRTHIRQRGFDHAALIARRFAKRRGMCAAPLLDRTNSLTQHTLSKRQREQAARDAFCIRKDVDDLSAPVLLIDDILTTGATMRACARELRKQGVPEVSVAIICRQSDGRQ